MNESMGVANNPITIISDCAIRVSFSTQIRPDLPAFMQSVCRHLEILLSEKLVDLIPSYTNLVIVFDAQQVDLATAQRIINKALKQAQSPQQTHTSTHHIPVCYSQETGLDLAKLSQAKNLSISHIIELHSQMTYQVYAIGFSPAFAYLAEIPEQLAMPRHATPRPQVPAGSVAIADRQTAIYPINSPAGWHILGRTPLDLSLRKPENLTRFKVGDQVQFEPISQARFQQLQQADGSV